jgi:hypothetical protein
MKQLQPTIAILSANRAELQNEQNTSRTISLRQILTNSGLAFKEVLGCFNEHIEDSFVVNIPSDTDRGFINELASRFDQDCWLLVACDRTAYLVNPSTDSEAYVGRWQSVSQITAHQQDSFTFDVATNTHYAIF